MPPRKFKPGQSGNPKGRPRAVKNVIALARSKTEDAINTLYEIMTSKGDKGARVRAAQAILDRGWGKPPQRIEKTVRTMPTEELLRRAREAMDRMQKRSRSEDDYERDVH